MPYNAGTAYLQVIPSFRDIEKNIVADLRKVAKQFGDELGKSLPKALTEAMDKASKDAGKNASSAAEEIAKKHAESVQKINDQAADQTVQKTRETVKKQGDIYSGLETLRRRRAELALREFDRFTAQELKDEQRAEDERAKILNRSAQDRAKFANAFAAARQKAQAKVAADTLRTEEQLAAAIEKAHDDAFREDQRRRDAQDQADVKSAEQRINAVRREIQDRAKLLENERKESQRNADNAFQRTTAGKASTGVANAAQSIQNIPAKLNFTNVDGEIQRIRAKLDAFKGYKIGVNIDVEDFVSQARAQFERLREIAHDVNVDIDVRVDAAAAATELGGVLALMNRLDGDTAHVEVNVDADTARARMSALAESVEVNLSRMGQLIAIGAALGSAIVPAAAVATAAIGAIGTAAAAAAIGVGVVALAFGGIGDAVKALGAQQDDAAKNSRSVLDAEDAVRNAVDGVNSARRALANTVANNKDAAIRAAQAVADAERALEQARKQAAQDAIDAARRVADTERDLAKARKQAARDAIDAEERVTEARQRAAEDAAAAARRVADAQRDLSRDEENAKRAREELTQAYRDAQRAFEDLSSSMKHNSLDQQTALLDIADAKAELDKLMANPRATEEERERARIAYEERKLQLEDLTRKEGQLAEDYDDYATNGVEGSKAVVDAQRRVQDADEAVARGRQELADAQKAQTKALLDGQKAIAKAIRDQQDQAAKSAEALANAQRAMSDALRAQRDQAVKSAESIADAERRLANERRDQQAQARQAAASMVSAQQSLVQAQRSLAGAYRNAGEVGAASMDKVNQAMQNLSPTAQAFARFIFGLKDEFYKIRAAAADGVLSGIQTAITKLLPYLPAITDFVRKVGNKLGQMFVDFADALKEPVFVTFFDYIKKTAIPTLDLWFNVGLNLLRGFVGLFTAFTPFSDDVSGGVLKMSQAFADWATNLDNNKGFQEFLGYIRDNGPTVMEFFGSLIKLGWRLIQAMAPLGPIVIKVVDAIISFLAAIPPDVLMAIVAGIAAIAAAISIMGVVTSALAISATAWAIGLVVAVSAIGAALIALLVTRVKPLRDFFVSLWKTTVDGAKWLWSIIEPILVDIGAIMLQLWKGAAIPAFKGIWELIQQLWAIVSPLFQIIKLTLMAVGAAVVLLWKYYFKPYFQAIADLITKVIVPVIKWLYENIIKPVFALIQIQVNVLVAAFKVGFGLIQIAFKILGLLFTGFYKLYVKPWLDPLMDAIKLVGGAIGKWIQPYWEAALKKLGEFWQTLRKSVSIPIRFIIETLLNDGILKGYNKLADMFDVTPKNVQIPAPKAGWATGGVMDVLPGYSPGVDNHTFYSPTGGVIGLSGGEGILRPEVTMMVRPWLDNANAAARQGGRAGVQKFLGGYSKGGVVPGGTGDGLGDWWKASKNKGKELWNGLTDKAGNVFEGIKDFATDPGGYLKKILDSLTNLVPGKDTIFVKSMLGLPQKFLGSMVDKVKSFIGIDGGGGGGEAGTGDLGNAAGGRGWKWQIATLRKKFPGLDLYSGYRHSYTANGSLSWHGRDGGRAVDVPPRHDVFNYIHDTFGKATQELIWLGDKFRNIHHGKHHVYDNALLQQHGVAGMPNAHIHWAYDNGGWLPDTREMPGQMMSVFHGRRQPDAVLSNNQWDSISRVARQGMTTGGSAGDTYNFDFEKSQLTPDRLAAIQSRRDTLERVSRPNR
jgi:hypothetical protein